MWATVHHKVTKDTKYGEDGNVNDKAVPGGLCGEQLRMGRMSTF